MLINTSYFVNRPLFIPKAVLQPSIGSNTSARNIDLERFIDEKERCLLLSFLGYEQYTELSSQLNTDGTFKENAADKWKYLVDGINDWKGLRYEFSGNKISLIAYYVYFFFIKEDNTYLSNVGVQSVQAVNSIKIMPNDKQVMAWSEFLRMYGGTKSYSQPYSFFHNWNGMGMQWVGTNVNSNEITLYDFMTKNSDVYDVSKFTFHNPVNSLGL